VGRGRDGREREVDKGEERKRSVLLFLSPLEPARALERVGRVERGGREVANIEIRERCVPSNDTTKVLRQAFSLVQGVLIATDDNGGKGATEEGAMVKQENHDRGQDYA
jgi:hypothetical protein